MSLGQKATEPARVGPAAPRRSVAMTVVAQDPSFRAGGEVLLASAPVPTERLDPGPRGHRFHVVDFDATTGRFWDPTSTPVAGTAAGDLVDPYADADPNEVIEDLGFHAQNVYAVAARTLALFERHLGRRLPWRFADHQLFLVPHAFVEGNAYYSPDDRAVFFGYLPSADGEPPMYTCLSHDIIAHEVTHAILDGIRPRFLEPGLPDQTAFHEALGDIVALLSVLSIEPTAPATRAERRSVVEVLITGGDVKADEHGRIPADRVTAERLRTSALGGLAEQFGQSVSGGRQSALRRSVELEEGDAWMTDPAFNEPHRRGEVLVAAIMTAFIDMWTGRLRAIISSDGTIDLSRTAEEGRNAAAHLLGMCIRALDYMPPVDLEFRDFLEAILGADEVLVPDDDHDYRGTVIDAFGRFGIASYPDGAPARAETGPPGAGSKYQQINHEALAVDRDEVYRFIWMNADLLHLDLAYRVKVERVRHATRVGPDGFVVSEIIADYIQTLDTTFGELGALGIDREDILEQVAAGWGPEVPDDTEIQLWGAGVLVFDQFGGSTFRLQKPLSDTDRQTRRLVHLIRHGVLDSDGRYGFSDGTGTLRFATLHRANPNTGEAW
jgi:hypothetical protein